MRYLIIYDSTGKIYYQASGDVTEPTGIPYLWVEVSDGQYISSVDVSGDEPAAVLVDLEDTSALDELKEQLNTALETLSTIQDTLDTLLLTNLTTETEE